MGPLVTRRFPIGDHVEPLVIRADGETHTLTMADFAPLRAVTDGLHPATRHEVESLLGLTTLDRVAHRDGTTLLVLGVGETGPEQHEIVLEAAFRLPSATAEEPGRRRIPWIVVLLSSVTLLFVIGAVVLGVAFVETRSEVARLADDGTRTRAQVTGTELTRSRSMSQLRQTGWIDTTTHVVRFRYEIEDGDVKDGEQIVEPAVFEAAEATGAVDVVFLPDDPGTVRIIRPDGSIPHPRHGPILVVTAILAAASGWVLQRYLRTGVIS
ncbi:hypothetical protein [Actinospongicola halichondriae]|uniref:hypothetical protein n=1 Tax=Actinospongicola halichondriae TaxID=3236844 RepID=UPI003D569595